MKFIKQIYLLILIFVIFFAGLSCSPGEGIFVKQFPVATETISDLITQPQNIDLTSTPTIAPSQTPVVNMAPEIRQLVAEIGSLCPGARTEVLYQIVDEEDDQLNITWASDVGTIEESEDKVYYTAPDQLTGEKIDRVHLTVSDGKKEISKTTEIRLISEVDLSEWEQTNGPEGGRITSIEINSSKPNELYVSTEGGIYHSKDAGSTWQKTGNFFDPGQIIHQVLLNQMNPDVIYANTGVVFKSINQGQSFSLVLDEDVNVMDISRTNPEILLVGTHSGNVFLSRNGGSSWSNLNLPVSQNSSVFTLAIAREDEYWIATRSWSEDEEGKLFHTVDGGSSWRVIENLDQASKTHIETLVVDPVSPNHVYVGLMHSENKRFEGQNPRIMLMTDNAGKSWTSAAFPEIWDNAIVLMGVSSVDHSIYIAGIGGGYWFYKAQQGGGSFDRVTLPRRMGTYDIAFHPENPDIYYLATVTGVLKTVDGGSTFEWVNSGINSTSLSLLEVNPDMDSGTLYASSAGGEGVYRSFNYGIDWEQVTENGLTHPWGDELQVNPHRPHEVWFVADIGQVDVSKNQGDKWQTIIDPNETPFRYGSVYSLALAPSNPEVLYAQKNGFGIYKYQNWISNPHEVQFLHNSEVDYTFSMAVHSENEDLILSGYIPKPFQNFAWVRISEDGGETWDTLHMIEGSEGVTSIAFSHVKPDRLYYASAGVQPAIYRLDSIEDKGQLLTNPKEWSNIENSRIHYIEVLPDPVDQDVVYLASYPGGIYKSENAGESWKRIDTGLPEFSVRDPIRQGRYNLSMSSANPSILYVGIHGVGVFQSLDRGNTWEEKPALEDLGILSLAVSPADPYLLYVGSDEGIYQSQDGGDTWSDCMPGMEGIGVRSLAWSSDQVLFAGTLGYEVFRLSHMNGLLRQLPAFGNNGVFWPIWNDRPLYQYVSLIFHPDDPAQIIMGTFPAGIYISEDGGKHWRESNTGWTWDGVFTLAYHPENPEILFAGTYNGVNRSTDGGRSWEMWDHGWPDEQWVFSIDFDPQEPEVMYAASKNGENEGRGQPGFFMGTVMKSMDGGQHWYPIMNGLPRDQEYYKIIVDPFTPDVIYLASQRDGVYISQDAGNSWQLWIEGLTNPTAGTNGNNVTNTMEISSDGLYLFYASAGSGVFRRMTVNAGELCGCIPGVQE